MKSLNQTCCRNVTYPPSILIIKGKSSGDRKLKHELETNGCQVHQIDAGGRPVIKISQEYFDLIVLDSEPLDQDSLKLFEKLVAEPELAALPKVILTSPHNAKEATTGFTLPPPVYRLSKDNLVETKLLQMIEQIDYMTDRYM